jgi:hypothetical protein
LNFSFACITQEEANSISRQNIKNQINEMSKNQFPVEPDILKEQREKIQQAFPRDPEPEATDEEVEKYMKQQAEERKQMEKELEQFQKNPNNQKK